MRRSVLLIVFAGVTVFAAGLLAQRLYDARSVEAARARERAIVAWVVAHHPEATIRDFDGFVPALLAHAADAGIDWRLVLAIVAKESGVDPRAVGRDGEIGLMQLLPSTAVAIAKRIEDAAFEPPVRARGGGYASLGTLGDPKQNVRYGIAYLAEQVARFDGVSATALRAYNRAPSRARESRPWDRYAEDVAMLYVQLAHALPPGPDPAEPRGGCGSRWH